MSQINYKHLHYFWVVAKAGGVGKAADQLHLTPQSISSQLGILEESLGVQLFRKSGRKLELTDTGRLVLSYAESIFVLGDEMQDALRQHPGKRALQFKVGIADVVSKTMAYQLLEPAIRIVGNPKCCTGKVGWQPCWAIWQCINWTWLLPTVPCRAILCDFDRTTLDPSGGIGN